MISISSECKLYVWEQSKFVESSVGGGGIRQKVFNTVARHERGLYFVYFYKRKKHLACPDSCSITIESKCKVVKFGYGSNILIVSLNQHIFRFYHQIRLKISGRVLLF